MPHPQLLRADRSRCRAAARCVRGLPTGGWVFEPSTVWTRATSRSLDAQKIGSSHAIIGLV